MNRLCIFDNHAENRFINTRSDIPLVQAAVADKNAHIQFAFLLVELLNLWIRRHLPKCALRFPVKNSCFGEFGDNFAWKEKGWGKVIVNTVMSDLEVQYPLL